MTLYVLIELVCATVVMALAVRNLNAMTGATSHWIRAAYIILAVGSAASVLVTFVRQRDLTLYELSAHLAIALLMIADRRRHGDRRKAGRA